MNIGMDHIAEDDVPYFFRFNTGPCDCLTDNSSSQFGRGFVFQATAIVSNRRTDATQDDNLWLCHVLFSLSAKLFTGNCVSGTTISFSSLTRSDYHFRSV